MNKQFVTFAEARVIDPQKTHEIATDRDAWTLKVTGPDGEEIVIPPGSDISFDGFAGSGQVVVALDGNGQPRYDKFLYEQKPGVAIVAWGLAGGTVKLFCLKQLRPFAYDPQDPEKEFVFGQIPMGFFSRADRKLPLQEGIESAVRRELQEEVGVGEDEIIKVEIPSLSTLWAEPTFLRNGTYVAFAQINLNAATCEPQGGHGDGERIQGVELIPASEMLVRIKVGRTPDGVVYQMGESLGPLIMFFTRHPEFFEIEM